MRELILIIQIGLLIFSPLFILLTLLWYSSEKCWKAPRIFGFLPGVHNRRLVYISEWAFEKWEYKEQCSHCKELKFRLGVPDEEVAGYFKDWGEVRGLLKKKRVLNEDNLEDLIL